MELALAATVLDSLKNSLRITALTTRHTRNGHARNEERDFVLVGNGVSRNLFQFFWVGGTVPTGVV